MLALQTTQYLRVTVTVSNSTAINKQTYQNVAAFKLSSSLQFICHMTRHNTDSVHYCYCYYYYYYHYHYHYYYYFMVLHLGLPG